MFPFDSYVHVAMMVVVVAAVAAAEFVVVNVGDEDAEVVRCYQIWCLPVPNYEKKHKTKE